MKRFNFYICIVAIFFIILCLIFYLNNVKLLKVAILDTGINSSSVESKVIT